jgi:hypothetical protein
LRELATIRRRFGYRRFFLRRPVSSGAPGAATDRAA